MVEAVIRAVRLSILPSLRKDAVIERLIAECTKASGDVTELCWYWDETPKADAALTRFNVQKIIYNTLKKRYALQAQLVCDIIKDTVVLFKNNRGQIDAASASFNIPRSGNIRETKRGNPVVSMACFGERLAVPIIQDGAWLRFKEILADGYECTNFRIVKNADGTCLVANVKKEVAVDEPTIKKNVLGVDVGSRTLAAVSIINRPTKKVIKQLYLGRDVWHRQRDICVRRSKLESHRKKGSKKAARYLRKLKRKESNFNKTRAYQISHEICNLAIKNDCVVSIENLIGLKDGKSSRKGNRRVKRMPYRVFQAALGSVCTQKGIPIVEVNPAYTSQACSRCNKIGMRVNEGKSFACACGFFANADRNASVNIAHGANRILTVSTNQITVDSPAVNQGVRLCDGASCDGLHPFHASGEKANDFSHW